VGGEVVVWWCGCSVIMLCMVKATHIVVVTHAGREMVVQDGRGGV
jgi:hypothetical protein